MPVMSRLEMCFIWGNEVMSPTGLFIPSGPEVSLPLGEPSFVFCVSLPLSEISTLFWREKKSL